jgi:hypothetical protein
MFIQVLFAVEKCVNNEMLFKKTVKSDEVIGCTF